MENQNLIQEYEKAKDLNSLSKSYMKSGVFFSLIPAFISGFEAYQGNEEWAIVWGLLSSIATYHTYRIFKDYKKSSQVIKNLENKLEIK